jgi:hypothetical protein
MINAQLKCVKILKALAKKEKKEEEDVMSYSPQEIFNWNKNQETLPIHCFMGIIFG